MRSATIGASTTLALLLLASARATAATAYYVDSANRAATQDGRSPATAWSTLAQVNAATFAPGDVISFQRGSVFAGALAPRGSGAAGAPIAIVASGSGARPRIDGGTAPVVLKLFNQEQWEISGLEITGGGQYGVWISGDAARAFTHLRLSDCVVHGAWSTPRWDSGLVVVSPDGVGTRFSDVVIDGVTAYDTNLWFGIHVGFNMWASDPAPSLRGSDVAIRNCVVHDVYGDNITVADTNRAVIERNTVWNGGRAPAGVSYTPNAIWSWSSDAVTVQFNEAYGMASYGVDGGAFDIDWGSTNTVIQYNYAHDNQGYGVAVLGAHNQVTANSLIRYNVFAADRQAEVVLYTWDGGSLDGVAMYGNTMVGDQAALNCGGIAHGAAAMSFRDNLIVATGGSLIACGEPAVAIDHDLGWRPGGSASGWNAAWGPFADPRLSDPGYHAVGFPTSSLRLQAGSSAIGAGVILPAMGGRDFFGDPLPTSGAISVGAHHLAVAAPPPPPPPRTPFGGSARAIPGTIQAEDFDEGGEGIAYHDLDPTNNGGGYRAGGVDIRGCVDAGGGWQVGWMGAGEWLEYSVTATAAIQLRSIAPLSTVSRSRCRPAAIATRALVTLAQVSQPPVEPKVIGPVTSLPSIERWTVAPLAPEATRATRS